MSKIEVILTAVLNDGKNSLQPGDTVSMEREKAERLAALGMVKLPKAARNDKPGKLGKKNGKGVKPDKTKAPALPPPGGETEPGDDPDTLDDSAGLGDSEDSDA
jgi:hypothetical protein